MISGEVLEDFRSLVGSSQVLSDPVDLALYSYDAAIDRGSPCAAVFPETAEQISAVIRLCVKKRIPFVARGAGTNLCGGSIPLRNALVIAPTRMKRILSIDRVKRTASVEPGLPNLFLKKALEPHGLYYAPDPASQKACTIGGNIGTNAGGPHCLKYGVTSHHVLGLKVVLPDGEMAEFDLRDPGYDLVGLFVGSEGTLGIVAEAKLNLLEIPPQVETMLVAFPSLESAIQTVSDIISQGILPATLEAMDKVTIQAVEAFVHAGYPTDAEAVLLIEVDGGPEIKEQVEEIREVCQRNRCNEFRLAGNEREREKLWEGRRGSYPAMARLAPNVLVEDGAVPRNRLPEALKRIRLIAEEHHLKLSLIFHAGDGNLHPQILFDERDPEQTARVKRAGYLMLKTCVDLGGSISGEHGIGTDKREAMKWLFTPETLRQFRRIKNAFDPENLCNPDKLIPMVDPDKASQAAPRKLELAAKDLRPQTEEELRDFLYSIHSSGKKAFISGTASRFHPRPCDFIVSTLALNKILEHDVENFTVTVQAGMKMADLREILKGQNQKVLLAGLGTVGGLLSVNPFQNPRIRDQVLGIKAAMEDGSLVQFGGKVMKNVAGYDASKLFLGARGTLGVIVSIILKTYPTRYPVQAETAALPYNPVSEHLRKTHEKIKAAFDPLGVFPALPEVLS